MSLTLPIEEFVKFHVQAKICPGNGAIAFNVSPSKEGALFPTIPSGLSVHFKTVVEKGVNVLSISTSFDGEERRVEEHDTVHRNNPSSNWPTSTPHFIENQPPMRDNFSDILSGMHTPLPNYEQTRQGRARSSQNTLVDTLLEEPDGHGDFSRGTIQESQAFPPRWCQNQPAMDADFINMLSGMLLPADPSIPSSQVLQAATQLENSWQAHSFEGGAELDVEQSLYVSYGRGSDNPSFTCQLFFVFCFFSHVRHTKFHIAPVACQYFQCRPHG
ncbi:hypothetical protein DFH06DRAFT_1480053 [Mycena polygramma]|nr:hypothetical protein DFH06DRAFT_1480053 [Mycena polygramma]